MDRSSNDIESLLQKLEQIRLQRTTLLAKRQQQPVIVHNQGDSEQWKTRALIAEARLADMESMLKTERGMRQKLASEKSRLEATLESERENIESTLHQTHERVKNEEQNLLAERRRLKASLDSLRTKLDSQIALLQHEQQLRASAEDALRQLEMQLEVTLRERDEAIAEARLLAGKLEVVETTVLPKAREDQSNLERQIEWLKNELEDTIESESAFRTLFLKTRSSRRQRQQRDPANFYED